MIRKANKEDFPRILEMSRDFWAQTQFSEPFDTDRATLQVELAHSHGLLAVLDINGVAQGFIAGAKNFLLASSGALSAVELAYWICPEYRKGTNGIKLMKALEVAAKEQGIKYLTMVSMETSNPKQAERIYMSRGYTLQEKSFTKVLL